MSSFLTWLFLPPQLPLPLCQLPQLPQLPQLSTLKLPLMLLIKFLPELFLTAMSPFHNNSRILI
jgi:hypothetical protein